MSGALVSHLAAHDYSTGGNHPIATASIPLLVFASWGAAPAQPRARPVAHLLTVR